MKVRKLFAGIAAAATLLGGMALGAASAQAADPQTTPLLQVNNAQEGHMYTPYKFATFENADNGTVEVSTVEAWKDAVTAAADTANGNDSIPAEYKNNPAAYVATFNAEQIRKFAEELAKTNPLPTADGAGLTVTAEQAGTAQPVAVDGEGWYLVTDTYNGKAGTPAVVATTVNGLDNLRIVADAKTGQGGITTVGRFNAKNENPLTPPSKTAKVGDVDVNGKTVNVGDTVDFTVSAAVPASAANYDVYPFTITDTASKGLKVAETNTFKVQVDGKDVDAALYKVEQTGSAAVGTTTTITFASAKSLAGKTIVVSYTGVVTKDALTGLDGSVDNKATTPPMVAPAAKARPNPRPTASSSRRSASTAMPTLWPARSSSSRRRMASSSSRILNPKLGPLLTIKRTPRCSPPALMVWCSSRALQLETTRSWKPVLQTATPRTSGSPST